MTRPDIYLDMMESELAEIEHDRRQRMLGCFKTVIFRAPPAA